MSNVTCETCNHFRLDHHPGSSRDVPFCIEYSWPYPTPSEKCWEAYNPEDHA